MLEFIKKRKIYIIVIIILIIYFIITFSYASKHQKDSKQYANIVMDGKVGWEYQEQEWRNIYELASIDENKIYKLYTPTNNYENYTIRVNNNKIYAFDNEYNSLQYNGKMLAINSNYDINVIPINYESIDSNDTYILQEITNNYSYYDIKSKKTQINIDNDEEIEQIYIVDCYNDNNIVFSGIYLYDNNKLTKIVRSEDLSYIKYDIEFAIDLNEDLKYELIVSINYNNNLTYNIYKLNKNKYELFLK